MTLPQIRQGIAVILYEASRCGTSAHMLHERQKRLQRNELARFYHWKVNIRLPHLKKLAGYHRVSSASGVMRQYAPATLEAVSAPSDTRSSPLTLLGAAGESHGAICLHVGKATRRLRP